MRRWLLYLLGGIDAEKAARDQAVLSAEITTLSNWITDLEIEMLRHGTVPSRFLVDRRTRDADAVAQVCQDGTKKVLFKPSVLYSSLITTKRDH